MLFVLCPVCFLYWIRAHLHFDGGESFDWNPEHNEIIFEEVRISRVLVNLTVFQCSLVCFLFVFISGLLNDLILKLVTV